MINLYGNGIIGRVDVSYDSTWVEDDEEGGYYSVSRRDERFFYFKDHLGSIRMTLDENSEIVSAQDYYPYGEILRSYTLGSGANNKYLFTEKERDTETNYDYFGARFYDSELGKWLQVDPLADKLVLSFVEGYPGWSPYNYTFNNPLRFIDPDGREGVEHTGYEYDPEVKTHKVTIYAKTTTNDDDGSVTTTNTQTVTVLDQNGVEISTNQTTTKTTVDKDGNVVTEKSQSSGSSDFHQSNVSKISGWAKKNGGSYAESKSNDQSYFLSAIGIGIALVTGKYEGLALPVIVLLDETNKRIHPHLKNVTYLGSNKIKKETVR
jgi:RHS repeat-associated protein